VTGSLLMGNGSHACVLGVGTINLKFTSGKTVLLKHVQHVPSINKNFGSGFLLCRDGLKLYLNRINVYFISMGHLLEKAMSAEACSTFLCLMMLVIRL
jgi:hypothetical protein